MLNAEALKKNLNFELMLPKQFHVLCCGAGNFLGPVGNAGGSDVNFKFPGDGLGSGSLSNTEGPAQIFQSEGNAGSFGGGIDGES